MLLNFACQGCGAPAQVLTDDPNHQPATCAACGGAMKRNPTGPSMKVTEKIDNGIMARACERLGDGERLARIRTRPGPAIE